MWDSSHTHTHHTINQIGVSHKPSKLLAPTRLHRTFVFSNIPNPTISPLHQPMSIGPFLTASQAPNNLLTIWVWMDKDLANVPLNDVSMEKVRVKEFGESKDEDCG